MRQTFSNPPPIMQYVAIVIVVAVVAVCAGKASGENYTLEEIRCMEQELTETIEENIGVTKRCLEKKRKSLNQVTAYRASDGGLFESREEWEVYQGNLDFEAKCMEIVKALTIGVDFDGLKSGSAGTYYGYRWTPKIAAQAIKDNWPEIKAIMEPKVKP